MGTMKASLTHRAKAATSAREARPMVVCRSMESNRGALAVATAAAAALMLTCGPAMAEEPTPVAALFTKSCAGCHNGGGNVLQAGASLSTADLQRNGVDSPEELYNIIYKGKNKMPGYGVDCAPKGKGTFGPRLSDEDISSLVTYIQERAAADWK